ILGRFSKNDLETLCAFVWFLWSERNEAAHRNCVQPVALALAYVESWLSEYKLSNHLNVTLPITATVAPSWYPQPFGKLKLNV
ncbi:hypothetical protein TorRG33x02_309860, partial [Trema orientale]